jgi:hypothetical protein
MSAYASKMDAANASSYVRERTDHPNRKAEDDFANNSRSELNKSHVEARLGHRWRSA